MSIKSSKESTREGYKRIKEGQSGDYVPIKTRYEHLNKISHGGLLKQKIYTIGGLSSFGKSHTLRQIETDIFDDELNPGAKENVILIKVDFEQTKEEYILTKVHEKTGKDFGDLMFKEPDEDTKKAFNEVYVELTSDHIFETFDTYNPDNFYKEVQAFIKPYVDKENVLEIIPSEKEGEEDTIVKEPNPNCKRQIFLTIDNINLIDKENTDESAAISKLVTHLIRLKRANHNLTIIILAQLNRELKTRVSPKEHFPRTTDFYFSSKIEHASDIQLVVHNPYLLGYSEYGAVNYQRYEYLSEHLEEKNKYAVFHTKGLVFWHYVKVRLKNSLKDFKDVYIEKIFDVDDNDTEFKETIKSPLQMPIFNEQPQQKAPPVNFDLANAFDNIEPEEESDVPF